MATALDLITRAYRKGRILGADQVLSAARGAAGLDELNDLLDEWWITKLMVFHILVEQFALQANKQSYTMGAAGDFNTTRPVKVVPGTKFTLSSVDRQLTVLTDRKSWDEIPYKSLVGPPQGIFVDEAYPLATIYFYPIPDQAYTVYINSWGAAAEHRGADYRDRAAARLQPADRQWACDCAVPECWAGSAAKRGASLWFCQARARARQLRAAGAEHASRIAAALDGRLEHRDRRVAR
jgi:hypothetical protein